MITKEDQDFKEIISIIENAKENAFRVVNRELIMMYWEIGKYISGKLECGKWGKSVVEEFSNYIQTERPDIKGFSASNLWRMRQFFDTYRDNEKLATLSRELSWSLNLKIMGRRTDLEREFYMRLAVENSYSFRELERQIDSGLYERTMLSGNFNIMSAKAEKYDGMTAFRYSYVLEFIDVPANYGEKDLRKAIVNNLKDFILEFGKDFTFVGDEYRLQVGNKDFYIDLLFFNRKLSCLVAIELKVVEFRPEHLRQLEFYLEALDRDVKRPDENPSVGLILCAGKDDTVVEYALSRSMSPALVAEYQLSLPNKALLENKLRELKELAELEKNNDGDP